MPLKWMKRSREEQVTVVHHPGEGASTSNAVPLDEKPGISSGVSHQP